MSTSLNQARDRHTADVAALNRGRVRLADAQAQMKQLAAEDAEAIARHAQRLEAQTRSGSTGPVPSLVPTEAQLAARDVASRTLAAVQQMVKSLEVAEAQSRNAAAAMQTDLTAREKESRESRKRAEMDRIAARLNALREEEWTLCARLAAAVSDMAAPMLTPAAELALNQPRRRPVLENFCSADNVMVDIETPRGGDRKALAVAQAFWADFDATLDITPAAEQGRAA